MRVRKWILRGALMLGVALIGVAAVLFVMASQFPEGYEPLLLTQEQRKQAAHDFEICIEKRCAYMFHHADGHDAIKLA